MKKVLITFATLALAVASAASNVYHVTLNGPASLGGKQFQAGEYKIQVEGNKAIIKSGKNVVEVPAKVENGDHKFESTQVSIENADTKPWVNEIRIGGTTTKILFDHVTSAVE
jgi:hypothetical protein